MREAAALLPCPFCGGEAYLSDDASHSRAYFIGCKVDDCFGEIHWEQTKAAAIAAWNRRATPTVQEAAKVLLAGLGDFERDRSHPSFEAAFRGYADSNKPAPFNRIGDGLIAALRAIAGEIHD